MSVSFLSDYFYVSFSQTVLNECAAWMHVSASLHSQTSLS